MVSEEFLSVTEDSGLSIGLATPPPEVLLTPNIGVIGVGGAGGNAVNNMVASELSGVSFFAANTDAQALSKSLVADRLQLGVAITKGLGAGANPEVGKAAAEETADKIKESLNGLHLLFITAGMGGGTGTGAAPVIAKLAKDMNILTVGVVSKPFRFEGARRMRVAEQGISELQKYVDTLIVIPNQNLFRIAGDKTTFAEAFQIADDVLCQGVRSITDLVMNPGLINLDFADVRTVLSDMGRAMMGTGEGSGENRAAEAAERAISNPLLDNTTVKGARSILINVSGGSDLTLSEVDTATERIVAELHPDANIIFGATMNEDLQGKIRVSLVATGIDETVSLSVQNIPDKPKVPEVKPIEVTPTTSFVVPPAVERHEASSEIEEPTLIQTPPSLPNESMLIQPEVVLERTNVTLAVDLPEPPAMPEPALFEEAAPIMAEPVPVDDVPEVREEVNVAVKRGDANVKTVRSSLFDLVPNLMGKRHAPKPAPKKEPKETPLFDLDDNMDLPAFLRRP